jgi:curved DNA-binding protein CbpA
VSHYDVLGIASDASASAVRAAYVARARQHHPDRHTGADPATRSEAQRMMQRINEAWLVLGDPGRRAEYDLSLMPTNAAPTSTDPGWRPGMVHPDFVPYDDDGDEGDDEGRFDRELDVDDTPYGRPVPRSHQILPVASLFASFACLAVGLAANIVPLLALGGFLLVAAGLGFILTPMLAVMRSAREHR